MSKTPELKIEMLAVDLLQEYEGNARQHGEIDINAIKASILEFGFNDPIGIWGDIVLDPFGGSGTTLITCEQLKRKCAMVELDPHYCDVIIDRWEKLTGNTAQLIKR